MAAKSAIIKFGPQRKDTIKGRVAHSRTGACTAKGRCYHGWIQSRGRGKRKGL